MENKLKVIVGDTLWEVLNSNGYKDETIENLIAELKKNISVFYDEETAMFVFLSSNQNEILNGFNTDFSKCIRDLYSYMQWWYDNDDFGIKKYENIFSWSWREVYKGIKCYINDEDRIEKIFDRVKKIGLNEYINEISKIYVSQMIQMKIEEITTNLNMLKIERF